MLIKRSLGVVTLHNELQRNRINNSECPICGLSKDKWKRRRDWTCCSKKCTDENHKLYLTWNTFKLGAFKRDKFTCVRCGFKAREESTINKFEDIDFFNKYYTVFEVNGNRVIIGAENQLIADHIIPIALGGEEWDLDNIQTLCKDCNKIKTKNDIKLISLERKRNRIKTEKLNFK